MDHSTRLYYPYQNSELQWARQFCPSRVSSSASLLFIPESMDSIYEANHAPELSREYSNAIAQSFEGFQRSQLSGATLIRHTWYQPKSPAANVDLISEEDIENLRRTEGEGSHELFFIHKHLILNPREEIPKDANRLRISGPSLETLATRLKIPLSFIFALARHYLPNGRGSRRRPVNASSTSLDLWYFLPVRVQVESPTPATNTPEEQSSQNQMNPFHKLHLPNMNLDIRRSCVAIFTSIDPASKRVTFVAFDFMHGRWPKVALEPRQRIEEVINDRAYARYQGYGHAMHLVYLSSVIRWWTNALNSINEQLIAYELKLQAGLSAQHTTPDDVLTTINRALHAIAAHLHRYLSELKSSQAIVMDLATHFESLHERDTDNGGMDGFENASRGFSQVLSQIEALHDFAEELEKKITNHLALLFNRIQINSDRLLVANGQAMQAILSAMHEDTNLGRQMAKASHALAQEMKRDSVAMRTIAVVTMFFLPGATFAVSPCLPLCHQSRLTVFTQTLLSMPFFSNNEWLEDASRFWIWIVMTVPSTGACFLFYHKWIAKSQRSDIANDIHLETQISRLQ
ncbi:hypothetical protein N7462_000399 [Penicillium macrosclerotiorum]|uniref:uncharacterized protein n=1 Tax=Penicillium macrosclerotiorum TaxID=303699 RepID=UPI002547567B|nr:uncharacterized protein N7462_000399 [Penicillium macrosclerotiorum]KAJ5698394.1 hypothetical protein N7462_000399 [Penicillium macrosclerotiorum]